MLNLFKRNFVKNNNSICMPVNGKCMDISECNDTVFSKKIMGDGFVVESQEGTVCSPCDGTIAMIFPTKHAIGIRMKNGTEILLHIGIDTVNLNGKFFNSLCSLHDNIKIGTPLIKYDINKIKEMGYDSTIIVVVCGEQDVAKLHLNEYRKTGDIIIEG